MDLKRLKAAAKIIPGKGGDVVRDLVDEAIRLQGIIDLLPNKNDVGIALAEHGSFKNGKLYHDMQYCRCDPDVGMGPCSYCLLHGVLASLWRIVNVK